MHVNSFCNQSDERYIVVSYVYGNITNVKCLPHSVHTCGYIPHCKNLGLECKYKHAFSITSKLSVHFTKIASDSASTGASPLNALWDFRPSCLTDSLLYGVEKSTDWTMNCGLLLEHDEHHLKRQCIVNCHLFWLLINQLRRASFSQEYIVVPFIAGLTSPF